MFISKEMIKDMGYESAEEFILDQDRSHKIRIRKFTAKGVDFDYELDSGGTDDGKLHLSKSEVAREILAEVERVILDNTYPHFRKDGKPCIIWKPKEGYDALAELKKKYTEGET